MARGKKKDNLSLDEKLEQALVPADEQPYDIPTNWCWVKLGRTVHLNRGSSPRPIKSYLTDSNDGINWIKIGDTNNGKYINSTKEKITEQGSKKSVYVRKGDLLLTNSMSYGKPFILMIDGCIHDGWFAIEPSKCFDKEYLYYSFLASQWYFDKIAVGTAVRNISSDRTSTTPLALPPLKEQQRIVEQIENLFSKLDEAKEKAQEAVEAFANIQSAILYDAFTGKLTENWRKENCRSMDSWKEHMIQEVCSMKITDGTHKTPTYCDKEEGGIPFISSKDVTSKRICWDNIKYIIPKLHEELYKRLAPQVDDVLLAKNGTTGVAAIVEEEKIFDIYVTLAVLRPNKDIINPRYLLNIVNSPICKNQFDEHLTGIGVPNLHLRDIKEVKIKVPEIDEQRVVVDIIDTLLRKEQLALETASKTIEMIDLMKKSILAKAFRGKLGTNELSEPSSIELLKEIL